MIVPGDFDSWQDALFPVLRESNEEANRQQRANEELPGIRAYRAGRMQELRKVRKGSSVGRISRVQSLLWIDSSDVLSREPWKTSTRLSYFP